MGDIPPLPRRRARTRNPPSRSTRSSARPTPPPSGSKSGEDARALIPHLGQLALVEVAFPKFRDGRGYSAGAHPARGGL